MSFVAKLWIVRALIAGTLVVICGCALRGSKNLAVGTYQLRPIESSAWVSEWNGFIELGIDNRFWVRFGDASSVMVDMRGSWSWNRELSMICDEIDGEPIADPQSLPVLGRQSHIEYHGHGVLLFSK